MATGRLVTETGHVAAPEMIFFTTTSFEIDEELANRCLILTVDESRERTRRIRAVQHHPRAPVQDARGEAALGPSERAAAFAGDPGG